MQDSLNPLETASPAEPTDTASRRAFLTRFAALGTGLAALQLSAHAQNAMGQTAMGQAPMSPAPMSGTMPMTPPPAMMPPMMPKNEMEYRMAIAPVANLSLATSRIAVDKATDPAVRQFATFELAEAIAVTTYLNDMKTPMPPMSAMDRATLNRAQNTPAGADFDRDYITKQNAAHTYLRDTATNYLGMEKPKKLKGAEQTGHYVATVNLPTFVEHLTHTQDIMNRMIIT